MKVMIQEYGHFKPVDAILVAENDEDRSVLRKLYEATSERKHCLIFRAATLEAGDLQVVKMTLSEVER